MSTQPAYAAIETIPPISVEASQVRQALLESGLETPLTALQLGRDEKYERIRKAFIDITQTLGLDLADDSLAETPHRIARMYVDEIFAGLDYSHFPRVAAIDNKMGIDEMVRVSDISLTSTCEHHFVTIDGTARVAYLPKDKIIGLSKINRIVRFFAQRPQVQERLTRQVLVALQTLLDTDDVAVSIDAVHYCVKSRGVMDTNSRTQTTALGGAFKQQHKTRAEFLADKLTVMKAPTTIDPQELRYYERLAEQWWDETGKFWPLHRLNRIRRDFILRLICSHFGRDPKAAWPLRGISMVDIGCGGGLLSESMAVLGARVTGIDVVGRSLQVAHRHAAGSGLDIDYREMTVEALARTGQTFDVLLNMEVIEHVNELPTFMRQCGQLSQPDGLTFVATINRNWLSWLVAIVGAEYVLGWLPRGTHRWSKFVTPRELAGLLADSGLVIDAASGVRINPLTRRFSLSPNLGINYMVAASFRRNPVIAPVERRGK